MAQHQDPATARLISEHKSAMLRDLIGLVAHRLRRPDSGKEAEGALGRMLHLGATASSTGGRGDVIVATAAGHQGKVFSGMEEPHACGEGPVMQQQGGLVKTGAAEGWRGSLGGFLPLMPFLPPE